MITTLLLLTLMLLESNAQAEEETVNSQYNVIFSKDEDRITFDAFEENAVFSRNGKSLGGYGLGIRINYAITSIIGLGGGISQVINFSETSAGISALYTSLRTNASLAILGSLRRSQESLIVNGESVFIQHSPNQPVLTLDAGIEEFLFNGTSQVSPGSGLTAGATFRVPFKSLMWLIGFRTGVLSLGGVKTIPALLDLGITIRM